MSEEEFEFEIDYKIVNVVATAIYEIKERIDLTIIARKFEKAEYNPERFPGLIMRMEKPKATALIFSTGKAVITGLRSHTEAEPIVKKIAKNLKKAGIIVSNPEYTIQNIVASGNLHMNIDLNLAAVVMNNAMYEPEVFPGLIYRMQEPKAVFLIFSTGKIVCTGIKTEEMVRQAVEKLNGITRELELDRKAEDGDFDSFQFQ